MKVLELAKAYNPKDFEDRIYDLWNKNHLFEPAESNETPFVIVIPPPNVTGVLHMGHGLNNILQDIIIRYYRMKGVPTLWLPGTDHAGIATQNVVEKKLRAKGKTKHDLGREEFLKETWKVKEEHQAIIIRQLQKIGASCDWSRERFTLDEGLSKAVREVFVTLYERDLIYQGDYLVNWCTSCGTALSDDEVEHAEVNGKLYHYLYPLSDGSGTIEIATTRPETMLGDTAVAVHPDDNRYKQYIGKEVSLPLTDRQLPIIADAYVDKDFGTGVVKVTPGHDINDWEMGKRHNLEIINILNADGTLNQNVPEAFQGLTALGARKKVVEQIKESGLFLKEEIHHHQVGHCYRCETIIEPYLSKQWFVRMKSMALKALKAWEDKEILFFPKRWENTYTHWLKHIKDWCISRQLWWGHRIPVWYCNACGATIVSRTDLEICSKCSSEDIKQDPDVLDTWFSSWLWPFSTLGWPADTEDIKRFFPTTALVTGYDIIFFWVARMIMAGMEFLEQAPFRDIYITGLVRDKQGRKMSKSLGNGMDPLDVVGRYGADSLKFSLAFLSAQGQDVLIDMDSFKFGSRFANKIWNAARFLFINIKDRTILPLKEIEYREVDRWIMHQLNETIGAVEDAMASYRFNDASQSIYEFFWSDFCDWYVEAGKLILYTEDDSEKDRIISLMIMILEESLRLLHPFLSFITEEIYQQLHQQVRHNISLHDFVITAPYPKKLKEREFSGAAEMFSSLQEAVRLVRTLRSEFAIAPDKKFGVHIRFDLDFNKADFFQRHTEMIQHFINSSELTFSNTVPESAGTVPLAGKGYEIFVFVRDVIDVPQELTKMKKELAKLEQLFESTTKKLQNPSFIQKAPADVVEKEKKKLEEFKGQIEKLSRYVKDLA